VVEKDALTVQGEAMLEQIKASQASCSFNGANFAPLTQSSGTDYTYSSSDNHYTWTVNICANTIAPCQGDSSQSPGVWNYDFQQPYACFNLANPTTGTWSMVAAGGQQVPQLAYTGGDACYNVQPASTYTLAIQFVYDATTPGKLVNVVNGATQCDFVATFNTKLAGSSGGAGGAGAWVFVGIVLGGLPLYFAAGYIYNWKVGGKEGPERIPNHAFWSDLPTLVMDGMLFFVYGIKLILSKCTGNVPERPIPGGSGSGYASASASTGSMEPVSDTSAAGYGGGAYGGGASGGGYGGI